MSERKISDLDVSLAQMRAMMLLEYGGTLLAAKTFEEKREAFSSVIMAGVELIASAICSRRPHDEALRITIEHFPKMITDAVNAHNDIMAKVEASIEREGATVQ